MHTVKVRNYQSIEDVVIEIDGFTVVVGRTNVGKSCLIRSCRGAIINQTGDSFVRAGATSSEVRLEGDGLDLLWEKGGGKNQYTKDGEVFSSVSRGQPEFIAELGFGIIESGDHKVYPQIASQFDMPFLTDKPGSFVAEAITSVSGIERITPAVRAAEKDLRDTKSSLKVRNADLEAAEGELKGFEGLDEALVLVKGVAASETALGAAEGDIQQLEGFVRQLQQSAQVIKGFSGLEAVQVPEFSAVEKLREEVESLTGMLDTFTKADTNVKQLEPVAQIEVPGFQEVTALAFEVDNIEKLLQRLTKTGKSVQELEGAVGVEIPEFTLDGLQSEYEILSALYERYVSEQNQLKGADEAVHRADLEWGQLHKEFETAMGDTCPLCERTI